MELIFSRDISISSFASLNGAKIQSCFILVIHLSSIGQNCIKQLLIYSLHYFYTVFLYSLITIAVYFSLCWTSLFA